MIANVRSRSSSESSSYSSHSSASSTDTSLCDENERISDSESELPGDELKESSHLETSANNVKTHIIPLDEKTTAISDFIHSAAGEPLRTYIDAFQTKANQPLHCDYMKTNDYKSQSSFNDTHLQLEISRSDSIELESKRSELLLRLSQNRNDDISKDHDHIAPTTKSISPRNFTELSPVDISPCNFGHNQMLLSLDSGFKSPLISKSVEPKIRPPDIIDSLTMYPNFVPDIDLSEKSISDIESPSRSPGAESIVISEDEPPIPLKIDKYFEHSPDFFGARITITNSTNSDIPSRRPTKRQSRLPKKPDSLTLQGTYKEKPLSKNEGDRASSLPHSTSTNFEVETSPIKTQIEIENELKELSKMQESPQFLELRSPMEFNKAISPKEFVISSGRKNSERALQIIQENSKILNRILTKQNILDTPKTGTKVPCESKRIYNDVEKFSGAPNEKYLDNRIIDSPLLKESTSDSLIGYCKRIGTSQSSTERNEFTRIRPISLDDPFSLESRSIYNVKTDGPNAKTGKSPNSERLENKTDIYGWENKGFMAKCGFESHFTRTEQDSDYKTENKGNFLSTSGRSNVDLKQPYISEWMNEEYLSEERKSSVTLPSSDVKDIPSYEKRITSDDYSYSFSSKYNDFVLSKASDICSKTVDRGPKVCENVSITDSSQLSDFAHVVTSSISFTYEPSVEDDFLTGAKSNSSDTLCQITSLDQVSTPISPKIFPTRETPTFPKESLEKNDRMKYESDDTCSAITSLIESDTLSSLSYPRSPSTGSYHPFPARPAIRMPKELGIRLGMYPRDSLNSPSK
ncbi:hypothetical protein EVAR_6554_1 [Eumeta japonica]|uniref:Uncharacterized protein n=1 Tax=Eumeta variegata TaxID=151549 RepID=A0A4C1SR16_EUMVA|nr:hypothetical protein EVAR_6554_1 [Eumeta japonica]